MAERPPFTRRHFLRLVETTVGALTIPAGLASSATLLSACSGETDDQKLERLNSVLAGQIESSMGITSTTTPDEYARLCYERATDPGFALDKTSIGKVVGLNGNQIQLDFNDRGGKSYTTTPDMTKYFVPIPIGQYDIFSAKNPSNKLIYLGSIGGAGRIQDKNAEMGEFLDGYVSSNRMPYTLLILAAPRKTNLKFLGINSDELNDADGVSLEIREKDSNKFVETQIVLFLENIHRASGELNVPLTASLAQTLANERVLWLAQQHSEYTGTSPYNERFSTYAGILAMVSPNYRPLLLGGDFGKQLDFIAQEMKNSVEK